MRTISVNSVLQMQLLKHLQGEIITYALTKCVLIWLGYGFCPIHRAIEVMPLKIFAAGL